MIGLSLDVLCGVRARVGLASICRAFSIGFCLCLREKGIKGLYIASTLVQRRGEIYYLVSNTAVKRLAGRPKNIFQVRSCDSLSYAFCLDNAPDQAGALLDLRAIGYNGVGT